MDRKRKKNPIELKNVLFVSAPDATERQRKISDLIREVSKSKPDTAA